MEATHDSQMQTKDRIIQQLEADITSLRADIEQLKLTHAAALVDLETALRKESEESVAQKVWHNVFPAVLRIDVV
jgi:hypothetical protein